MQILLEILDSWEKLFIWFAAFFIVFPLLAYFMPCNPNQRWLRRDMATDILYFFVMPILNRFAQIIFVAAGVFFIFHGQSNESINEYLARGYGPLSHMPLWLQAAVIFLVSDIILYFMHRWFHGRDMWRFHAIHHSPTHVDWLSTYRFHPVNSWLSFTMADSLMLLVGFSPEAVTIMAAFNLIYSAMVHANLNWTFGPFRHVFASPVFHRWHHTAQAEGLNKNFAPTFPLLDIIFGTFYMPEGKVPEHYGIGDDNFPTGFIGQMIWPFKNKPKREEKSAL